MTGPGSHGRPPSTIGPGGKGSEARARASWSGRCGWWRWMSRIAGGPFGLDRGGMDRGADRAGGPGGGDRRPVHRPRRRGSGGSPACPAARIDCGRPRPPCVGRRRRVRAGSRSVWRVPGGGRSPRPRRSTGRRRVPASRGRRGSRPTDGRRRPGDRAGRRCGPDCPWGRAGRRAGPGRAGPPSGRSAGSRRSSGPRRARPG